MEPSITVTGDNVKALAHPLRVQVLGLLRTHGPATATTLARRLGLARALLRHAPITLLDEPTEGLDPASEQEIIQRIRRHLAEKTLIWVTHRATGLADFDRVLRLENGQLSIEAH